MHLLLGRLCRSLSLLLCTSLADSQVGYGKNLNRANTFV